MDALVLLLLRDGPARRRGAIRITDGRGAAGPGGVALEALARYAPTQGADGSRSESGTLTIVAPAAGRADGEQGDRR
jgi:hypothetical protein